MLEEVFPSLAGVEVLGNSAFSWIWALGLGFVAYLLVFSVLKAIAGAARSRAKKSGAGIPRILAEVFGATRGTLLLIISMTIAARTLTFSDAVLRVLGIIAAAAVGVQVALWLATLASVVIQGTYNQDGKPKANTVIIDLLTRAAQLVIWSLILIVVLDNAGVNVTTFIASLGIGGMAIAFALQKILGDLFASVAIGLDKPFEVGQFISFDGKSGTVERVGIKTTHLRTLGGDRLVVANSKLTDATLNNISVMQQRGVTFNLRLAYGTDAKEVQTVLKEIQSIIEDTDETTFGSAHLINFADSGLQLEIRYTIARPDFGLYRDLHQSIILRIMEMLEGLDIDFAVPTRRVRVTKGESIAD